jgi:hypothetical protein
MTAHLGPVPVEESLLWMLTGGTATLAGLRAWWARVRRR